MRIKDKVTINESLFDLVGRFNAGFDYIKKRLVNRNEEVEIIKLAILCRAHVMLEGKPGTAKTMLARRAFSVFDQKTVRIYKKQFMPNTQTEEVFGPIDMHELKVNSRYVYNTEGMLPEAHFAFLDEVYRASQSILPTLMGILNERMFFNGPEEIRCPLVTAVGTTNFVSENPELEAFHDRWLAFRLVKPADSPEMRRAIIDLFLEDEEESAPPEPITLGELNMLQKAVRKVKLSDHMLNMYEDLVCTYRKGISAPTPGESGVYISDRRYCEALRIVQATALLESNGEDYDDTEPTALASARYALLREHTQEHITSMDTAMEQVIGRWQQSEKEEPEIIEFEELTNKLFGRYDTGMEESAKKRLLERTVSLLDKIAALPSDQQFVSPKNIQRFDKVKQRLGDLKLSIQSDIGIK